MCEIFGASLRKNQILNDYLKSFYSHCDAHPNGWGLAVLDGNASFVEKEPMRADSSKYLRARLSVPVNEKAVLAHIRYATIGNVEYRNCHPFTGKDATGRRWTLVHNGTIFDCPPVNAMMAHQTGDTDSERVLLYILSRMNAKTVGTNVRLRFLDEAVATMAKGNKLNLLFYDGEFMYAHTNLPGTLHYKELPEGVIFSTQALENEGWQVLPQTRLLAFKDGQLVYAGADHGHIYEERPENIRYLYQTFSGL